MTRIRQGELVKVMHRGREVVGVAGRVVDTPDGLHVGVVVDTRLVWFGPDDEVVVVRSTTEGDVQ